MAHWEKKKVADAGLDTIGVTDVERNIQQISTEIHGSFYVAAPEHIKFL